MQSTKDILLSELYWKLHRNSTISSFLLFLSSNGLIHIQSLLGATVEEKNDNLVSFLLFVWASYAAAVFLFEGSREGARKTIEVREKDQKQVENFEKVYEEIRTSLTIIKARLEPVLGRMGSNIESLERNRNSVSPGSIHIRERARLISKSDELAFLQICSQDEDSLAALTKLKGTIADGMYEGMSEILQHSQADLHQSVNGVSKIVDELVEQLRKAEGLLNTKNRQIAIKLSTEKIRSISTGLWIPFAFYLLAIVHFAGLYCPHFPSAIDLLTTIHLLK